MEIRDLLYQPNLFIELDMGTQQYLLDLENTDTILTEKMTKFAVSKDGWNTLDQILPCVYVGTQTCPSTVTQTTLPLPEPGLLSFPVSTVLPASTFITPITSTTSARPQVQYYFEFSYGVRIYYYGDAQEITVRVP